MNLNGIIVDITNQLLHRGPILSRCSNIAKVIQREAGMQAARRHVYARGSALDSDVFQSLAEDIKKLSNRNFGHRQFFILLHNSLPTHVLSTQIPDLFPVAKMEAARPWTD